MVLQYLKMALQIKWTAERNWQQLTRPWKRSTILLLSSNMINSLSLNSTTKILQLLICIIIWIIKLVDYLLKACQFNNKCKVASIKYQVSIHHLIWPLWIWVHPSPDSSLIHRYILISSILLKTLPNNNNNNLWFERKKVAPVKILNASNFTANAFQEVNTVVRTVTAPTVRTIVIMSLKELRQFLTFLIEILMLSEQRLLSQIN